MIQQKQQLQKHNWFVLGALLLLLITVTLFPYGWLAERWRLFEQVTNLFFRTETSHIVGHFVLFAAMGAVILTIYPRLQTHSRLYWGLIVILGFLQEILQLTTFKHRSFAANDFFDIAVDVLGALAAFYWMTSTSKQKSVNSFQ